MEYDAVYVPKANEGELQMSLHHNDEKKKTQGSCLEIGIYASYSSQALQVGRSGVRSPIVLLEFFIDIFLPVAIWSRGRLSL